MDYLIVGVIVAWAAYFLWEKLRPGKGCSCGGSCACGDGKSNSRSCCSSAVEGIHLMGQKLKPLSEGAGVEKPGDGS